MEVSIIIGQGIAGSSLAWWLHWAGHEVHLIDRQEPHTASRIAAGLITPVTGRRMTKAGDFDNSLTTARHFYSRVEQITGRRLLEIRPSVRIFQNEAERTLFMSEKAADLSEQIELIAAPGGSGLSGGQYTGFRMLNAARLRVNDFLTATQVYFSQLGTYHQKDVDPEKDIRVTAEEVIISGLEIRGTRLFFCQGYQPTPNPWFPGVPDAPVRGEILQVSLPQRNETEVVHQGYWLAPVLSADQGDIPGQYLIGATYDRENLAASGTESGRTELLAGLADITSDQPEVIGHFAAVRAGTRQRQPVAEYHPDHWRVAILNGMGSRASLMAPAAARALVEKLPGQQPVVEEIAKKPVSLTSLAHRIIRRAVKPGDTVIDATAGNGHDTIFLSQCAGEAGRVLSIDIQSSAIRKTQQRIQQQNLHNVEQVEGDHSEVLKQLAAGSEKVQAIMFNLGYLPNSDKTIITKAGTTVQAVTSGLQLLASGGVMTVTAYRGHSGGREEADALEKLIQNHDQPDIRIERIPGSSDHESPVMYVFRRR